MVSPSTTLSSIALYTNGVTDLDIAFYFCLALPMLSASNSISLYNLAIIASSLGVGVKAQIMDAPQTTPNYS